MTTILIPEKLQELVNNWLTKSNRAEEHGGIFFGTEREMRFFVPFKNASTTRTTSFQYPGNYRDMMEIFSKFLDLKPLAGMHTHPNGTVPSEGDKDYLRNSLLPYEVIIADMGKEMRWFCVDRELKHIQLVKGGDIDIAATMVANAYNLTDLGHVLVSPHGEILSDSERARQFLEFDAEAYRVYEVLMRNSNGDGKLKWDVTKTMLAEQAGMTLGRLNKVLTEKAWFGVKK